jgi:hypothetical protein
MLSLLEKVCTMWRAFNLLLQGSRLLRAVGVIDHSSSGEKDE